ncbi:hypothetical protein NE237_001859 [Protea cynaroides]|uniref:Uncharacterized protein n=1 Tax=Protea cynaroides TaxID=273540 RepID=A0A9Q0QYI4_9MAGN|nr:hypothetical protein NE237_001859 [Protea cynaroides]
MDLVEKESAEELFHAQAHIWNYMFGYINSMSLRCAVQLGIPDIVHNHHQPITLSEFLTPFKAMHGRTLWDYACHDIELHNFNKAMASDPRLVMSVVVTECKWVFDARGGTGTTAKTIAETFPTMKCTLFDLLDVVDTLKDNENLTYIAGNMFEFIPHADEWILHDWNDEQCIKILKGCKEAIFSGDLGRNLRKAIIIEMVVDDRKEWEKLFLESRFSHYKITPILDLRSLIEVYPLGT